MAGRLLIALENASLSFGGKPLFEDISIYINEGDKICLVGKNGAGKTTLMKMVNGELELDAGTRFVLPNTRIGYLAQKIDFKPTDTVRDFVLSGLEQNQYADEKVHLAEIIIAPLELDPDAKMQTLSGGQIRRAALAQTLIEQPDLLMLDEPTNHLDLSAIEWLENYLASYRGALICISHDRTFLSNISDKVFWIDRGVIRTAPTGYAGFEDWQEMILEQEAREIHNLQKKINAEVDWTQGGVTGRRKRNVRRLRELARLRLKIEQDKAAYNKAMKKVEMGALETVQSSKRMAEFKHVSKSFKRDDGKVIPILRDFSMNIIRGDRIGIIGRNGSGKSTFLKLLINELQPDDGRIIRGKTIDISYFDQNRSDLDPEETLRGTLCPDGGDHVFLGAGDNKRSKHVCAYLKDFLFDPKAAQHYVATLSGGQQNRLMLARMLASPGNLLILDEPTNDLDMDTLDILQELIADYYGTLVIVSHDRDFLDRTVTEILAFEGDGIVTNHVGGYTDYYNATHKPKPVEHKKPVVEKPQEVKKPQTNKMSFKFKHELEKLPGRIDELQAELAQLNELLSNPELYTKEPEVFDKSSRRHGVIIKEIEKAEIRWLELEEMRQQIEAS